MATCFLFCLAFIYFTYNIAALKEDSIGYCENMMCDKDKESSQDQTKMPLKVLIFMGSTRENRLCDRVTRYVHSALEQTGHQVTLFDPEVMDFPLLKKPLHFYEDENDAPKWLRDADSVIRSVDAFVIITPEYNSGIPSSLKNMLDHFSPDAFISRPSAIVTYSPSMVGGVRASVAMKPILNDLQMPSVPYSMWISVVHEALASDGSPSPEHKRTLERKMARLIEQLDWYAEALRNHRKLKGRLHWSYL